MRPEGDDSLTEPALPRSDLTAATAALAPQEKDKEKDRPARSERLKPGDRVGRYLVIEPLGQGGMGTVYKAYDPELDRRVALKLLHVGLGDASLHQARLQREARALARLSHPNVVAVYDVGSLENDVFVAMEYVDGVTLKQWLATPRSIDQILAVFIAAGRGLEAAHRADLVHRDFKPANVMIGGDGRVRVLDFGLARAITPDSSAEVTDTTTSTDGQPQTLPGARPGTTSAVTSPSISRNSSGMTADRLLSSPLTVVGSLVGTPVYMAPEQLLGEPVDARTDQFAFCVALHEALYGRRPFAGRKVAELKWNVLRGAVAPAPRDSRVPAWVRAVVLRGLSIDPQQRYPQMTDLLLALGRNPWTRRKRVAGAIALLSALAAGGVMLQRGQQARREVCTSAPQHLRGVWDGQRKQAVHRAFAASGRSFAGATAARVESMLEAYTGSWVEKHAEVCAATRVRGEQSERVLDLRMACLQRRLEAVRALVDVFAQGAGKEGGKVVENAVQATAGLVPLSSCDDLEALTAETPPPEDPRDRARVTALNQELDAVEALESAGEYSAALARALTGEKEAAAVNYQPLHARALGALARLQRQVGQCKEATVTIDRAITTAARAADDRLIARLRGLELRNQILCRNDLGFLDHGHRSALQALARVQRHEPIEAEVARDIGEVFTHAGRFAQAEQFLERSRQLHEKLHGRQHPATAASLQGLADMFERRGKYARAQALLEQVLAIQEATLGPEHPDIARTLDTLCFVHTDPRDGLLAARRGLRIRTRALGPAHPDTALTLANIGFLLARQGDYAQSWTSYQEALRISEAALGPDHAQTAMVRGDIGLLFLRQNNHAEAERYYRRALEISRGRLGEKHPQTVRFYSDLGYVYFHQGKRDLAREYNERALQIAEELLGSEHPRTAVLLADAGLFSLDRGDLASAGQYYTRSLSIMERTLGPEHPDTGTAAYRLGAVQRRQGRLDAAAEQLARALAVSEKALGPQHTSVARTLAELGHLETDAGRPEAAIPLLERALAILGPGDPIALADARFGLARALDATGKQRSRARDLLEAARAGYTRAALGESRTRLAELQRWLAARR
jgi:serine/threonine-protein kinase